MAAVLLKIVQYLFRCDHILYTIVAVSGKQSLEKSFHENSEGVSTSSCDIIKSEIYLACVVTSNILVIKLYAKCHICFCVLCGA